MFDSLTPQITVFGAFLRVLGLTFWLRRIRRKGSVEPVIELEKLVNCRSCGSLIPEGARKCAFCGAGQRLDDSGE